MISMLNQPIETTQVIIVLSHALIAFMVAMLVTPIVTHFLYKYEFWKKARTTAATGENAPIYQKLHAAKHKRNIPTMAGVIIWATVALVTVLFNLDRKETWLPLFTIVVVGLLGVIDDYINVRGKSGLAGAKAQFKSLWLILLAILGGWWFYYKLGYSILHIPAVGNFDIGLLYIPLFIVVTFATANAVNITDGLDGLSGGLLASAFGAFGAIAFTLQLYHIAAFCAAVVGAILVYTWFNIYPARFFMGDTGSTALGFTLGVIALLTNSVFVLPIIGFVFVVEAGSSLLQILSKKIFRRKIFLSAPIHHHFEAIGWPETKVTMRFWVVGAVMSVVGLILGLLGRGS